jgi:glutathione synthase/RimK-type ligase-like ATP-grasp enzyme
MKTIAILVTHDYYPSRLDHSEPDYVQEQLKLLEKPLGAYDIFLEPVYWQDEGTNWHRFAAVLPLLAWGYPQQVDVLLARLEEIEAAGVPLLNDAATLRANMDKGYLAVLAQRGAPVPPTLSVSVCEPGLILASFDQFGVDEIIVKPRIGAGAWRQVRLKRGEPVPGPEILPPAAALIQPFLPAVTDEGELSLLFFGGEFSHALIKRPVAGDYRTQGTFGAVETAITAPKDALSAAHEVLSRADGAPFTYARVDLVRSPDGAWLLMELELIEPWLYLALDGHSGLHGAALLAKAISANIKPFPILENQKIG